MFLFAPAVHWRTPRSHRLPLIHKAPLCRGRFSSCRAAGAAGSLLRIQLLAFPGVTWRTNGGTGTPSQAGRTSRPVVPATALPAAASGAAGIRGGAFSAPPALRAGAWGGRAGCTGSHLSPHDHPIGFCGCSRSPPGGGGPRHPALRPVILTQGNAAAFAETILKITC